MAQRIVVISEDLAEPWDEGTKNFAWRVGSVWASQHDVSMISVDRSGTGESPPIVRVPSSRTFAHPALRSRIRGFDPHVILYVASPSWTRWSFLRCFSLRRHAPRARLGMVGLIPRHIPRAFRLILEAVAPDVTFVASYRSLLRLNELSVPAQLVPIGVDLNVFRPAEAGERDALRDKHGVPRDARVYLHVGHISRNRNVQLLPRLAGETGAHVILIGSTSTAKDEVLERELIAGGVRVIREVVPVHEFYRLADCYVFPTANHEGCVELPLSVFEALASGLPVMARPFGGLRDFLPAGPDLAYWETGDEFIELVGRFARNGSAGSTRDMSHFTWESVATRILNHLGER